MRKALGKLATLFTDGDWVESKDQDPAGEVRLIQLADIGRGSFVDRSSRFLNRAAAERLKCTYLVPGDILIARMPDPIGRACLLPDLNRPCVTAVDVSILRLNDEAQKEYVVSMINAPQFLNDASRLSKGATRQRVSRRDLGNIEIPLPRPEEQRRVVARMKECMERLGEIDLLRVKANSDREVLFESFIEAEFLESDCDTVTLSDVCEISSRLIDPSQPPYLDKLHVGGANIESGTGKLLKLQTSREEKLKSGKFTFDPKAVLYNKIRPYLKKVARPDFSGICSADMYPLLPDATRLSRDYLFFVLLSRHFTHFAIEGSNRAGMPKVNREHLFRYRFPLPTVEKQQQIVERLNEAQEILLTMRDDFASTKESHSILRDAVLRKAFAGEL